MFASIYFQGLKKHYLAKQTYLFPDVTVSEPVSAQQQNTKRNGKLQYCRSSRWSHKQLM